MKWRRKRAWAIRSKCAYRHLLVSQRFVVEQISFPRRFVLFQRHLSRTQKPPAKSPAQPRAQKPSAKSLQQHHLSRLSRWSSGTPLRNLGPQVSLEVKDRYTPGATSHPSPRRPCNPCATSSQLTQRPIWIQRPRCQKNRPHPLHPPHLQVHTISPSTLKSPPSPPHP